MKKPKFKFINVISICLGLIILGSCGSKGKNANSVSVSPSTTEISGPFGAAYSVVDKSYELTKYDGVFLQYDITIDLKRTGGLFPDGITPENCSEGIDSKVSYNPHFSVNFYDSENKVIAEAQLASGGQLNSILRLSEGEVYPAEFVINASVIKEELPLSEIKSFKVVSVERSRYKGSSETARANLNTSYDSTSTSDGDFNEFLASYEKYIDNYIALMKKAKDGDYSAMSDAASMMSDAQEYGEKLQKISGNLTPAQISKFQKLQQKLLSAAK